MKTVVGLVNYGTAGNIHSVHKALEKAGGEVVVINKPQDFEKVQRIVLPGVGSFAKGMQELAADDYIQPILDFKGPVLGICLGMQILSRIGYEHGLTDGLDLINAEVKPMQCKGKVPHVGFNRVSVVNNHSLFKGIEDEVFYFMHSYEVVNYTDIIGLTEYVGHKFVSAINNNNVYGVQFHPEKSKDAGIQLLSNFLSIDKV